MGNSYMTGGDIIKELEWQTRKEKRYYSFFEQG